MATAAPDVALILAAVEASGLSARRFAERILSRDERTVRRWSAGDPAIPPVAREWLEAWLALTKKDRATIVRLLAPEDE
jgi:hypothetical protein